jgi:flagellar motor switch protein FliM
MSEQFLSQEEVDALLEGVADVDHKEDVAETATGVRDYDLSSQERIVRGRMPTLEIINERFARNLRLGLFNFMRRSPEVSVGPVRVVKYSAFLRDIVVPTNINIISLAPLRGLGLVIFDPKLVFCAIDALFGGTGKQQFRIEGREFSPTEQRIIRRMIDVVLEEYRNAWGGLFGLNFQFQRSEMHTQFANIASNSEIVVAVTFNVEIGQAGGDIHLCFPYSSLEPIRNILYSSLQGDRQEPDRRWLQQLTEQVQSAEVEIAAELAGTRISVGELLRLQVGDFVGLPIREIIPAKVDGVTIMECRFGSANGHTAIRAERMVKYSPCAESLPAEERT